MKGIRPPNNPKKIYYVYAWLRQRSSANGPIGGPYYIGKGKGGRAYKQRRYKPRHRELIILVDQNIPESYAFFLEKYLIAYYGRLNNDTGILHNRTDGGEGASGYIVTEKQKQQISAKNKGRKASAKTRQKLSEDRIRRGVRPPSSKGIRRSPATIAMMKLAAKHASPNYIDTIKKLRAASARRGPTTPEGKRKQAEASKRRWIKWHAEHS